jgi:hypothetical protein
MRSLLQIYFNLPTAKARLLYIQAHPEINSYFDKTKIEKALQQTQLQAFEYNDPSLLPAHAFAETSLGPSAARMRLKLEEASMRRYLPTSFGQRKERVQPPKAKKRKTGRQLR